MEIDAPGLQVIKEAGLNRLVSSCKRDDPQVVLGGLHITSQRSTDQQSPVRRPLRIMGIVEFGRDGSGLQRFLLWLCNLSDEGLPETSVGIFYPISETLTIRRKTRGTAQRCYQDFPATFRQLPVNAASLTPRPIGQPGSVGTQIDVRCVPLCGSQRPSVLAAQRLTPNSKVAASTIGRIEKLIV